MTSELYLRDLVKQYGNTAVVGNINMEVKKGEMISLLGPSGCGKTTTLRMIAGLLEPTSGSIELSGVDLTHVPPYRRQIGMVFQNYALFPHLTIFENVAFGLRRKKTPKNEINERVVQALKSVHLDGFVERLPAQLSGGQQQRVALARALVLNPNLVLFDEPLSNLDAKLRHALRVEIRELQKKHGFTAIFVTHDQEEAMVLSDRIAVMHQGEIVQLDTPEQVYRYPTNSFVADFVGDSNLLSIEHTELNNDEYIATLTGGHQMRAKMQGNTKAPSIVMVRPEAVSVHSASEREVWEQKKNQFNVLTGKVMFIHFLGAQYLIGLDVAGYEKTFLVRASDQFGSSLLVSEGDQALITWPVESTLIF